MLFHLHKEIVLKLYYASFSYLTLFLVNILNSPLILRTFSTSAPSTAAFTFYTLSPYADVVAYTYLSFHITNVIFAHFFTKFISLTFRKGFYKHEVFFFNSINNLIFHNLLALSFTLLLFKLGFISLPYNNDSSILLTELLTWVKLLINGLYFLLIMSILLTLTLRVGALRITRVIYTLTLLILFSATLPTRPTVPSFLLSFTFLLWTEGRILFTLINRNLYAPRGSNPPA